MTDDEHAIAHQVHALLLEAHPQPTDLHLPRAFELASGGPSGTAPSRDDFRATTSFAIRKAREAIVAGASADQGQKLLLEAIRAAAHWVKAES